MPADPNLSVEEILAACRRVDGGAGEGVAESASAGNDVAADDAQQTSSPAAAGEEKPAAAEPAAKKPGEMSVSDVLAAARAQKQPGGAGSPAAAAATGKKPSEMSVADMLAAARAEKSGGGDGGAAPAAAAPKSKPAKAKPAAGDKAKPAAPAKPSGPKDTASILAAARSAAKPGPISKAEAAARGQDTSPVAKPAKATLTVPPMPERPSYARPAAPARQPAAASQDRRGFLAALTGVFIGSSLAVGFSSLAVTHVLWLLGLARFMFPNILTEPPTQFKVGFPDALAPGQVETKYKAEFGVWIVRYEYDGQPQIYAIQSVCTHLGCTPNWLEGEQKFKCPCHGSGFYKDGINFEGPAPRPLERFAIRLADDGQLEVDKSRKFKEEIGQWEDTASYVPV